jgi:hypothetical protein
VVVLRPEQRYIRAIQLGRRRLGFASCAAIEFIVTGFNLAPHRTRCQGTADRGRLGGPEVGDFRAATRTVNVIYLRMDKAGAAVATRPLTPHVASTESQGTSHNPTACQPGVGNHGERRSELPLYEPNFHSLMLYVARSMQPGHTDSAGDSLEPVNKAGRVNDSRGVTSAL